MTREYLAQSLRNAAEAHHNYEKELGHPDADWQCWYAGHMLAQMHNDFGSAENNPFTR